MSYLQLRGNDAGIRTKVITEIAEYFRKELKFSIPDNMPLVGADFNMTRAGIHADGILKDEEIYNVFDTKRLLNRPVTVAITDKSGVAGIVFWVHHKVGRIVPLSKDHPGVRKIYKWIQNQYKGKRTTTISDKEMLAQVREHLAGWMKESGFEL